MERKLESIEQDPNEDIVTKLLTPCSIDLDETINHKKHKIDIVTHRYMKHHKQDDTLSLKREVSIRKSLTKIFQ